MSEPENNSYGVHLLVDFKPIEEADQLLIECNRYIEESKQELFVIPFMPTFSIIASNVRAWRNKRRDSRLMSTFSILQPKIIKTEKTLRRILGEVVEKKTALRLQAKHLQSRLEACIEHNQTQLKKTDEPLNLTRQYVEMLSNESKLLKDMMVFNKEVLRMQAMEKQSRGVNNMGRWGHQARRGNGNIVTEVDISNDTENKLIEERLKKFREMRENFVQLLAVILEKRGVQQSNVENCVWSLDSLRHATRRDGVAPDPHDGEKEDPDANGSAFDHSRCADCSYGYAMACDCMSHLSALQKQANDANARLQLLVEARERMMESNELISQLDANPELRNTLIAQSIPVLSGSGLEKQHDTIAANSHANENGKEAEKVNSSGSQAASASKRNPSSDSSVVNSIHSSEEGERAIDCDDVLLSSTNSSSLLESSGQENQHDQAGQERQQNRSIQDIDSANK